MSHFIYITLRQHPELKEQAAGWFHRKWGVPEKAYLECLESYLGDKTSGNGWTKSPVIS